MIKTAKPTINIIGCGKLGKSIGKLLSNSQAVDIKGIINTSLASAEKAKDYIGSGTAYLTIKELPLTDIYLIATKDSAIKEIAAQLIADKLIAEHTTLMHCSGSLSSDELKITQDSQFAAASIHPIKSFANPDQAVSTFKGTYCAIEGDHRAIALLTPLFEQIGGIVFPIDKKNKKIYHTGGVMANNYLVTLHYYATQCYLAAGIDETIAKKIVSMLMQDGLSNIAQLAHDEALTGPIQRGDTNTIQQHLSALDNAYLAEKTKALYVMLGQATVELTSHQSDIKKTLRESLLL